VIKHRVQSTQDDKRAASRKNVLRQGLITFKDRAIYCAIHDLSATGAKLQVYAELPNRFDLSLVGFPLRMTAEVKWSRSGYVGVVFTQPLDPDAITAVEPQPALKPTYRIFR
jgi:hypothetical protein